VFFTYSCIELLNKNSFTSLFFLSKSAWSEGLFYRKFSNAFSKIIHTKELHECTFLAYEYKKKNNFIISVHLCTYIHSSAFVSSHIYLYSLIVNMQWQENDLIPSSNWIKKRKLHNVNFFFIFLFKKNLFK
jgi:hypothetical protein